MRETAVAKRGRARKILTLLQRTYPDARIALDFSTPLELLVATILSAQCTDERVNMVTPGLFQQVSHRPRAGDRGPGASSSRRSGRPASSGPRPARSSAWPAGSSSGTAASCRADRDALTALPGVGLKTANVVLGNAFGQDALAVDTHVFRVSQRLGLAQVGRSGGDPRSAGRGPAARPTDPGHAPVDHSRPADLRGAQARVSRSARSGRCARGPARPGPDAARALTPQVFCRRVLLCKFSYP